MLMFITFQKNIFICAIEYNEYYPENYRAQFFYRPIKYRAHFFYRPRKDLENLKNEKVILSSIDKLPKC